MSHILDEIIDFDVESYNDVIAGLSRNGLAEDALKVFGQFRGQGVQMSVVSWISTIACCSQNGKDIEALEFFREMQIAGVEPNSVTISCLLLACGNIAAVVHGKSLHCLSLNGILSNVYVCSALIDRYSKCNDFEAAERVFDMVLEKDVYTWNSMIGGWQEGHYGKAYDLLMKMEESDVRPNVVMWNVMISGYMQNADADQAIDFFQKMNEDGIEQNSATWNSLIAGYIHNGQQNKALGLFRPMQLCKATPNSITMLSILLACANFVAAKRGCSDSTLDQYIQMKKLGLEPNKWTFFSIICAYSLSRMVDEGKRLFSNTIDGYQMLPGVEYYSAVIDLSGRSGRFEKAIDYIEEYKLEISFIDHVYMYSGCCQWSYMCISVSVIVNSQSSSWSWWIILIASFFERQQKNYLSTQLRGKKSQADRQPWRKHGTFKV